MSGRHILCALPLCLLALAACRESKVTDPLLSAPNALAEAAADQGLENVFANPSAHTLLPDASVLAKASEQDAIVVTTPSKWRRLDREKRFDGVLLAGPTNEFQPLLDHLLDSPDFRLVYLDNWGVLFTRQTPKSYSPPDPDTFEQFSDHGIRAKYLSQMALILDAARLRPEANRYLAAATRLAPDAAIVQARAAALAFAHGKYGDALEDSNRALQLDPGNVSALEVKTRAYEAMGAATRAWQTAEQLLAAAPNDNMAILFLHARMANAAHAYQSEQQSLEKLIALAGKQSLPTTDYRVYLGQCFAKQGLARPALEQLELAAQDSSLDEARRKDIETAIATVRKRTGLNGE